MTTRFQPVADMNMTPLIDVLLVLLVMFIMTIPAATHSVDFDLPEPCAGCRLPALSPVSNKIIIDAKDRLLWNGQTVSASELAALLAAAKRMAVEPELQFEPAARASYETAALVLNAIKATNPSRFGFVGNERYRHF